jgi:hypothetical protein
VPSIVTGYAPEKVGVLAPRRAQRVIEAKILRFAKNRHIEQDVPAADVLN